MVKILSNNQQCVRLVDYSIGVSSCDYSSS